MKCKEDEGMGQTFGDAYKNTDVASILFSCHASLAIISCLLSPMGAHYRAMPQGF